jgi:hypothetical protein
MAAPNSRITHPAGILHPREEKILSAPWLLGEDEALKGRRARGEGMSLVPYATEQPGNIIHPEVETKPPEVDADGL